MGELVSAIITTYRRDPLILDRAIQSVLRQTYKNIELIIVNDDPFYEKRASIDKIVKKNGVEKYFVNTNSMGAGYSRNIGANNALGTYIAYLDDDDEWLEDKIETMIPYFQNDVGLVYCDLFVKKGNIETLQIMKEFSENQVVPELLNRNFVGGFSVPIILSEAIRYCGGMDENLLSSQDADLWRQIALNYKLVHVSKPLVKYYISQDAITADPKRRLQGTLALINKYDNLYKKYPQMKKRHVNRSIQNYLRSGWNDEARELFEQSYYNIGERIKNMYVFPLGIIKKMLLRR